MRLCLRFALLGLALLVLAGCRTTALPTRTAADFSRSDLDRIAVVVSEGNVAIKDFWTLQPDSAASASAKRLVPGLLAEYAPHFGVTLVDAREALAEDPAFRDDALSRIEEAVEAVRTENREVSNKPYAEGLRMRRQPLSSSVADEVTEVSERTGCRYLLTIDVGGWDATAGEKVTEALFRGAAAAAFGIVTYGGQPNRFVMIETALVDTERGEVVWYSTRGAELDPQQPAHVEALTRTVAFELFADRLIPPQSFLSPIAQDAVVYRFDGPRVVGRVERLDGLDVIVSTRNGEERVPLREVKSIRSFTGTGKLYPLDIPMEQ